VEEVRQEAVTVRRGQGGGATVGGDNFDGSKGGGGAAAKGGTGPGAVPNIWRDPENQTKADRQTGWKGEPRRGGQGGRVERYRVKRERGPRGRRGRGAGGAKTYFRWGGRVVVCARGSGRRIELSGVRALSGCAFVVAAWYRRDPRT